LLLILGTSLKVQPFAGLVERVNNTTPRVLINREKVGISATPLMALLGMGAGLSFDSPSNTRDIFVQGDCDEGTRKLAALIGWEADLNKIIAKNKKKVLSL